MQITAGMITGSDDIIDRRFDDVGLSALKAGLMAGLKPASVPRSHRVSPIGSAAVKSIASESLSRWHAAHSLGFTYSDVAGCGAGFGRARRWLRASSIHASYFTASRKGAKISFAFFRSLRELISFFSNLLRGLLPLVRPVHGVLFEPGELDVHFIENMPQFRPSVRLAWRDVKMRGNPEAS